MEYLMKLELYKFKVTGLLPLLTHNPASMSSGANGAVKAKKIPSPEEEAAGGLYRDAEGNFGVPSMGFRSGLLCGLKGKKVGKISAPMIFASSVFAVDDLSILIDPETEEPLRVYEIDKRRAIIQRNGVIRCRPRFPKWQCFLTLQIDADVLQAQQVEEHLNVAGQIIGVGDYRVERKGIFGKYMVELIE